MMVKNILIITIIAFILPACNPLQFTTSSTATPAGTTTSIPTLTATSTPTLEPWMQSLPEDVVSVEQNSDSILGINTVGERVMVYDIETGAWMALAIDEGPVDWVGMDGLVWRANNTLDIEASSLAKVSSEWFSNGDGHKYGLEKYAELQDAIEAGDAPAPPAIKYIEDLFGGRWVKMEIQDRVISSEMLVVLGHNEVYGDWLNEGDINAYPMQKSGEWILWEDSLGETWLVTLTWRHWKDSENEKQVTPVYFMIHPSQIDSVSEEILSDASRVLALRLHNDTCFGPSGSRIPLLVGRITPNWPFDQVFSNGPNWIANYQDEEDNPDAALRAQIWESETWEQLSEVPWGSICIENSE